MLPWPSRNQLVAGGCCSLGPGTSLTRHFPLSLGCVCEKERQREKQTNILTMAFTFPHVGTVPTAALCLRPVAVVCQALVPLTHGNTTRGHAPKQQYARGSHVAWDWDLLVFNLKETHDSERMAPGRPRFQDHANAH